MNLDKNEVFREATLRICGDLEIETAMVSFLQYIAEFIPVDRLFLQYFDQGLNVMRTIVDANLKAGRKTDLIAPITDEAISDLYAAPDAGLRDVLIYNEPYAVMISRELLNFHEQKAESLMVLPLGTATRLLGYVILVSEDQKYRGQHAKIINHLKDPFNIAMANALKHREVTDLKNLLSDENRYLHGELRRISGDEVIGANFGLKDVMTQVKQVSAMDSPVFLFGETGVGKDVIANMIHYSSQRSKGPFISVNCGAIPESLVDSELFGHEKGAFTGALSQKKGRFERANKGTIFLDEIGELPPPAQVRLLRVIQNKEIERVGGVETISLDIRVIAATNRNLQQMVADGQFREDLWYRLNVFPIFIPPLRERPSDIPALVQHFINLKSKELKLPNIPKLAPGAVEPLMGYHWPGNVRELANVIERALITNPAGPVNFQSLQVPGFSPGKSVTPGGSDALDEVVASHVRKVLAKTGGKVGGPGGAAELLQINPNTLRNRMDNLGITYGKKR
jgi:formate hydrogenlyase transcriptional activator